VNYPDPNAPGQDAVQPPPGQGSYPPPPSPGLPAAPPVPLGYGAYPAAALPPGMYLDPESGLLLPQGTELASIGRRIGAYFLAIPLCIVTLVIGYLIWGLIVWGNGQTPALQVLGMRCWRPETNRVPGFWIMALREVAGGILENLFGMITLITSFVLMVAGRERKSIHDYIAGTVVVYDPDKVLAR